MRSAGRRALVARGALSLLVVLGMLTGACGDDDSSSDAVEDGGGTDSGGSDNGGDPTPTAAPQTPPPADPELCPVAALDAADAPVEIELWHSMSAASGETLTELVDDYNASQDAVRVNLVYQGSYDESLSKYIAALRGGDLPDLMQTEETAMQLMVDSRSTVPAEACVDAAAYDTSDYLGEVLDQYRIEGVLVTMPFQLSNPVLYYDRAAFAEAGLDPDAPPATFEEVLEASRALVDAGVVRVGGMSLDADAWFVEQWVAKAGQPVVNNDNGRSARATEALLDSDASRAAFDFLAQLAAEGLVMPAGSDGLAKYVAVGTGDTAMTIGSTASLGTIYDEIGRFPGVEIGVAPLPGPAEGGVTVGGGSLWMMSDSSDPEKAAAWAFQVWLNEPAQQVRWSIGTGYIPSRASAQEDPELLALWDERPGFRVAFEQLENAPTPPGGGSPVIGDYDGVRAAIELAMDEVLRGAPAGEVVAEMQSAADDAIAEYNRRIGD
ncbi:MAG: ABC transporter substrate-binding protein [Acidimicrobiales bacterium]|nr:ABC transporter substrate-binding protein [Acidimicrobiales bacterium]